ncbi:probable cytochrome P450 6a18 [Musca autumnalis]|uniref:probable cytochrome P450 6a18 n=1 Tax=Musca autumnalis TaxID=221902 RepID=UPI003CE673F2
MAVTPLIILVLIIILAAAFLRVRLNYWRKRNALTIHTSDLQKFRGREHLAFVFQRIYNQLKAENKPYAGIFTLLRPSVVVADLDMLKIVYITEFESFPDRGFYVNYKSDPLSKNLVRLHWDLWHKMRAKLTPTFTANRMRQMFANVEVIGRHFIEVMQEEQSVAKDHVVDVRDLCARFTTDVIGDVAFGLQCNSLQDPNAEFRLQGDKAFYTIHPLMEFLSSLYPNFFQKIGYKVFPKDMIDFYSTIVKETVEYRVKNRVKRNDFLDLIIELKNKPSKEGEEYQLDMNDLIAQSFVFFIGGFETSSSTMSFALFELAKNPLVQEKARENVDEILRHHHGVFSHESLNEMVYIRQVVQETLRRHPIAPTGRRVCRRRYTFPNGLTVEPEVDIVAPIYAIHHDPEIYPQPEIFRPERFAAEERIGRHPMSYLPFGAGPRVCIAERFGMMQTMLGLAMLLHNFKFSPCQRTPEHLHYDPHNVLAFNCKDGIYLKVEKV